MSSISSMDGDRSTAPTSRSTSPTLIAPKDVGDLRNFAGKQQRFDAFIRQLEALPVLEPFAEPLDLTSNQLTESLDQHRRIEKEVDEFDKGDLDKWRALARGEHALWPIRPGC